MDAENNVQKTKYLVIGADGEDFVIDTGVTKNV